MTDTPYSRPAKRPHKTRHHPISRLPAFTTVPLRARKDGWTPLRQAEFIGVLAETRSVSAAAAFVGMSRESAYRLRRKPGAGAFVAVWDDIMGTSKVKSKGPLPKVTLEPVFQRILQDRYRPVMRGGKYVGTIQKPDNAALLRGLAQLDRSDLVKRDGCELPEVLAKGHRK
ncbi:hypothetical protein [Parasphingorhabdus halotolerans]|uniref:Transposase n=1 Tax=Parasphingorhabdus halotolerans TaxID=2725558 RepID=A0A6H2DJX4_9SPHN|nr:hypothetical protein [Parasphingorhabdus halotolerans]QJB68690.1 hypothetical protein HF685_04845 [Parasphingorhabdus halotolerans]